MVFFNYALRKLNAKIVYYGPGLCGKTTNLQWIHDHFEGGQRGKMISLATEGDRTIFFDLLPIDIGSIRGMDVTLQLYTVPGQVHYNSTRQLVLRGADGVVFVADSQRTMRESNVESFENLQENLMLQGIDIKEFPHVLQFNKRDLRDLLNTDELNESLNVYSAPIFEGIATEGIGVQETLEGIVKLVMRNLREKYEPVASAGVPKAPAPMQVAPPAVVTPDEPQPAEPEPLASDFLSGIDAPPAAEPDMPPPTFEAPPPVESPDMEETQAVGPDAGFAAFNDEDGIPTKVYEDSDEEIAQYEADQGDPSPPVDAEEDDASDGGAAPPAVKPEPAAAGVAESEPAAEPSPPPEAGSVDPEIVDDEIPAEVVEESMDDLFDAEPPTVQSYVKDVIKAGTIRSRVENDVEASMAPGTPEEVVAPKAAGRFEDRIEAPGPFAPPPADVDSESADETTDAEIAQREVQEQMRQAFGASENREALASLSMSDPERAPEPKDVFSGFLDDPPEVQPVVPPDSRPDVPPEVDEPIHEAGEDETVSEPTRDEEPVEVQEDELQVGAASGQSEVFDQIVVEAPVTETPVAAEPEDDGPFVEDPPAEEPAVSPSAFDDDPITKAEPIMVGFGDPFSSADDVDRTSTPQVIPQDTSITPAGSAIDVTAEDNQLHVQLKGSGAIAEMGQVRALDIEVPVPGQWVGNRKVTLQLRLTLTPAEDEND